jgi:hypothetical protein
MKKPPNINGIRGFLAVTMMYVVGEDENFTYDSLDRLTAVSEAPTQSSGSTGTIIILVSGAPTSQSYNNISIMAFTIVS